MMTPCFSYLIISGTASLSLCLFPLLVMFHSVLSKRKESPLESSKMHMIPGNSELIGRTLFHFVSAIKLD